MLNKMGPMALESITAYFIMSFLRKIKNLHLLFAPKREEERKIFEHYE